MELKSLNPKPWVISKQDLRERSISKLMRILRIFDGIIPGNVYMLDYKENRLVVSSSHNPSVLGYSKDMIMQKQFKFIDEIMSDNEKTWYDDVRKKFFKLFYACPKEERDSVALSLSFPVKNANGELVTLCQTVAPFDLDDDGGLWRAIVYVWTISHVPEVRTANITNYDSGEDYEFVNGDFILTERKHLEYNEIEMLKHLASGRIYKEMEELMNLKKYVIEKIRQSLFAKLGVKTSSEAVAQAMKRKLIYI